MYSIFDLFKIGVGPSSSHTVGPMIAAYRFGKECLERIQVDGKFSESLARVQVQLYGSLALTGIGHATDTAILVGLAGCLPDCTEPEFIQSTVRDVRESKRLRLNGRFELTFDEKVDLLWLRKETLPNIPMRFSSRHTRAQTSVYLRINTFPRAEDSSTLDESLTNSFCDHCNRRKTRLLIRFLFHFEAQKNFCKCAKTKDCRSRLLFMKMN